MSEIMNRGIQGEKQAENILESQEYLSAQGEIVVPLGRKENGSILVQDITRFSHIFVAGSTSTGKTSLIQALVSCIAYRYSPETVKFILFDSKGIDYASYRDLPHLMFQPITDQDKLAPVLSWICAEIDARFRAFLDCGVKEIMAYNRQVDKVEYKSMPRIFAVLDEMINPSANEAQSLQNILMKGRLAGVHLIMASSTVSVKAIKNDLISGFPCRISFRVSSKSEAKVILGQYGAEKLYVPGEMIVKWNDLFETCQSAYVSDENIKEVNQGLSAVYQQTVRQVGKSAAAVFDEFLSTQKVTQKSGTSDNDIDELFYAVGNFIIEKDNASIGLIQRRYRIGFNRATHIMDQLCDAGVVSNAEGARSRTILMTAMEFKTYCCDRGIMIEHI